MWNFVLYRYRTRRVSQSEIDINVSWFLTKLYVGKVSCSILAWAGVAWAYRRWSVFGCDCWVCGVVKSTQSSATLSFSNYHIYAFWRLCSTNQGENNSELNQSVSHKSSRTKSSRSKEESTTDISSHTTDGPSVSTQPPDLVVSSPVTKVIPSNSSSDSAGGQESPDNSNRDKNN